MIIENQELFTPGFSKVRYMTDDHRETGTVYPLVFSEVRYMTDDPIETETVYPWFSVRFVT
jgi:hypothetical protein